MQEKPSKNRRVTSAEPAEPLLKQSQCGGRVLRQLRVTFIQIASIVDSTSGRQTLTFRLLESILLLKRFHQKLKAAREFDSSLETRPKRNNRKPEARYWTTYSRRHRVEGLHCCNVRQFVHALLQCKKIVMLAFTLPRRKRANRYVQLVITSFCRLVGVLEQFGQTTPPSRGARPRPKETA